MLLSVSNPNSYTDLRLPSQPNGIVIPSDQIPSYIPINMRRKIFIVNDHMAVGVAGSVLHIKMFIEDLIEEFHNRSIYTYAEIGNFLNQYASSQRGEEVLEYVGALILVEATDWRGSLTRGLTNQRKIISQHFGKVITIGSGSDTLIEQVNIFDNGSQYGMSQPPDGEVLFPEFVTLSRNLTLLANLYWREFATPSSVLDAWGGAYDLIYQDPNRVFQYLTDYTIILRLFDASRAEQGIQLINVLKYERRPELSFIAMLRDGGLDFFGAKDITSSDAPMEISFSRDDFTMNSKIHISIIAIGKGNRFVTPMIQIDGIDDSGETKQTVVTWFDDEGRLCVFFHGEHEKWLEEQAMSYYKKHADKF